MSMNDEELSRLYKDLSKEQPAKSLDEKVLRMAREAQNDKGEQQSLSRRQGWQNNTPWQPLLATAAVVTLSVYLFFDTQSQRLDYVPAPVQQEMTAKDTYKLDGEASLDSPGAPIESPEASMDSPESFQSAPAKERHAEPKAKPAPEPAMDRLEEVTEEQVPPSTKQKRSVAEPDSTSESAAMPAPERSLERSLERQQSRSIVEAEKLSVTPFATMQGDDMMMDEAVDELAADTERRIEEIRALIEQGEDEAAREQLGLLLTEHPALVLPEDLRAFWNRKE